MNEVPSLEKRTQKKQKASESEAFQDTFRPKKGNVNFGKLKNEKAPPKKKSVLRKGMIALLMVVVLVTSAGAVLYFTGLLTPLLEMAGIVSPPAETQLTLEEREALLASREEALDNREKSLNKREEQLAAKEAELEEGDELPEIEQSFGERMEGLSDQKVAYLKKVSSIYSKMDPAEAAAIMGKMYDLMEISSILYYMQPAASALVLEQMETETAADITEMLLD